MTPPEDPISSVSGSGEDWQQEIQSLRRTVSALLLAGLFLSGSVFIFLWRETMLVRRQLAEQSQFVGEYQKSLEDLRLRLQAFTKTNPDFQGVFNHYFSTNRPPAAQPAGATPAPARLPPPN